MGRLRRITALLVNLSLAQLVLVESGVVCQMPEMERCGASAAVAGMDMSGIDMSGMDMSGMDMSGMDVSGMDMSGADAPVDPTSPDKPSDEAPCRFPWAPAGCQSSAPCGPAALDVPAVALARTAAAPSTVLALDMLAPPYHALKPELPPPRA